MQNKLASTFPVDASLQPENQDWQTEARYAMPAVIMAIL